MQHSLGDHEVSCRSLTVHREQTLSPFEAH